MSTCADSNRLGIIGCGATYSGNRQHSVARVAWSTHPDGRAHITASEATVAKCWKGDTMVHPADRGYVELAPGRWGNPYPDQVTA